MILFSILLMMLEMKIIPLFTANDSQQTQIWQVVDDGVMGGLSQGSFSKESNGIVHYSGRVSLENNGGFSSIRYAIEKQDLAAQTHFKLKIKGDGKEFQFRVKGKRNDYFSYMFVFKSSGEWQTISIPFSEMKPVFRGRMLAMNNYDGNSLSEVAFLIGNKKEERFDLWIESISAE